MVTEVKSRFDLDFGFVSITALGLTNPDVNLLRMHQLYIVKYLIGEQWTHSDWHVCWKNTFYGMFVQR